MGRGKKIYLYKARKNKNSDGDGARDDLLSLRSMWGEADLVRPLVILVHNLQTYCLDLHVSQVKIWRCCGDFCSLGGRGNLGERAGKTQPGQVPVYTVSSPIVIKRQT